MDPLFILAAIGCVLVGIYILRMEDKERREGNKPEHWNDYRNKGDHP